MKNNLAAVILVQPAGLQLNAPRLTITSRRSEKNLRHFREPFWEIGKDFGGHFSLIASRTKDARHQDPTWSIKVQERYENFDAKAAEDASGRGNKEL
jgi:hypothetical protein